jgi:hypothetical protein
VNDHVESELLLILQHINDAMDIMENLEEENGPAFIHILEKSKLIIQTVPWATKTPFNGVWDVTLFLDIQKKQHPNISQGDRFRGTLSPTPGRPSGARRSRDSIIFCSLD